MNDEEEAVLIRCVPGADGHTVREVRINCPDATGLGCDIFRVLLDFGLRIISADVSTDGTWCFLILRVALSAGVPPRWATLTARLHQVIPSDADALRSLCPATPKKPHLFAVHVGGHDRQGMLHNLTQALWESEVVVNKAHVTTNASGQAQDSFWVFDTRDELPQAHRVLELCDRIKGALDADVSVAIESAPVGTVAAVGVPASGLGGFFPRLACKDAASAANLRAIVGRKKMGGGASASSLGSFNESVPSFSSSPAKYSEDPHIGYNESGTNHVYNNISAYGTDDVYLDVDNTTSNSHTAITLRCPDRKGLLYDLLLSIKSINLRVAFGRVEVDPSSGICIAELFLQDVDGCRISDDDLVKELTDRLRESASLPIHINIADIDERGTELTVAANVDVGGRGRPRVTFDVTQGFKDANVDVVDADIYVEGANEPPSPSCPIIAREIHRFVLHGHGGGRIVSEKKKCELVQTIKGYLMGTQSNPLVADEALRTIGVAEKAPPRELLRTLSGAWKGY